MIVLRAIFGVVLFAVLAGTVRADADPEINLIEAHGFQCILTSAALTTANCDLLVLVRYELPKDDWRVDEADIGAAPTPTVEYMDEGDCIDGDELNIIDLCYTSLLSGIVSHTFYSGAQGSATLVAARTPPRVGHGLSAVYKGAGHGLTFGDTSYETCLEPSTTVFSPATPACSTLNWHTVTDTDSDGLIYDDAQTINATALIDVFTNLQDELALPTEVLMINNRITPVGAIFAQESFTSWSLAVPSAFAVAQTVQADVTFSTTPTAMESAIQAEATVSPVYQAVEDLRDNRMPGLSVQLVGGLFMALIGMMAFIIAWWKLENLFIASVIAALVLFVGVLQNLIDPNLYFVVLSLLFAVSIFGWVRNRITS